MCPPFLHLSEQVLYDFPSSSAPWPFLVSAWLTRAFGLDQQVHPTLPPTQIQSINLKQLIQLSLQKKFKLYLVFNFEFQFVFGTSKSSHVGVCTSIGRHFFEFFSERCQSFASNVQIQLDTLYNKSRNKRNTSQRRLLSLNCSSMTVMASEKGQNEHTMTHVKLVWHDTFDRH